MCVNCKMGAFLAKRVSGDMEPSGSYQENLNRLARMLLNMQATDLGRFNEIMRTYPILWCVIYQYIRSEDFARGNKEDHKE